MSYSEAVLFLLIMGFMEVVSYIPQTCITIPWIEGASLPYNYRFLDVFYGTENHNCSELPMCQCQKTKTGLFHTECGKTFSYEPFSEVPKDKIYQGTTHLTFVKNEITFLKGSSFSNLSELIYLDISGNLIEQLSSSAFYNLNKLEILILQDNGDELFRCNNLSLPSDVFKPVAGTLKILDASFAFDCDEASYKAFSVLTELEEIVFVLDRHLQIAAGFSNMTNLKAMNIFGVPNMLPDNFFQHVSNLKVEVVCMVGQFITHVGKSLANLQHLTMLDLSENPRLFWHDGMIEPDTFSWVPPSVTHLYLNKTGMPDVIAVDTYNNLGNLEVLSVDKNCLRTIIFGYQGNSFRHISARVNLISSMAARSYSYFFLGIFEMRGLISADLSYQAPFSSNDVTSALTVKSWKCTDLQHYFFDNDYSKNVNCTCIDSRLVCNISLPPNLESLQLSYNPSLSMQMELMGTATWTSNSSLSIVNMSSTNSHYLAYPMKCAENVKIMIEILDLSHNSMECINSNYFKMCHWTSLKYMDLSFNNLGIYTTRCREDNHAPLAFLKAILTVLEYLNLSHNNLMSFELETDISRGHLKFIDSSQNMLSFLPKDTTFQLNEANSRRLGNNLSVISIDLSGNQLVCECKNMEFYLWLYNTRVHLKGANNYKCRQGLEEFSIAPENLHNVLIKFSTMCQLFQNIWIPSILTMVAYILITFGAILYRLRHTVHYQWIKMRMNRHKIEAILNRDHQYHAFVSCDRAGAIWTKQNLLPKLEPKGNAYLFM